MSYFEGYNLEACTNVDEHGIRWMNHSLSEIDWLRTRWKLRRTHPSAKTYLEKYPKQFPWSAFVLEQGSTHQTGSYRFFRDLLDNNCFMTEGRCYRNALAMALRWEKEPPDWMDGPPMYAEGLYVDPEGAFPHAWVEAGGKAMDVTLCTGFMATYHDLSIEPTVANELCREVNRFGLLPTWEKSEPLLIKLFAEAA